jgi:flagellar biosynthesis protein FliQ
MLLLRSLLVFLEIVEYLSSPVGLAAGLWISLYEALLQIPEINLAVAILLPALPMLVVYSLLKQVED